MLQAHLEPVESIPYMAQKKQGVYLADFDKMLFIVAALSSRRHATLEDSL